MAVKIRCYTYLNFKVPRLRYATNRDPPAGDLLLNLSTPNRYDWTRFHYNIHAVENDSSHIKN